MFGAAMTALLYAREANRTAVAYDEISPVVEMPTHVGVVVLPTAPEAAMGRPAQLVPPTIYPVFLPTVATAINPLVPVDVKTDPTI